MPLVIAENSPTWLPGIDPRNHWLIKFGLTVGIFSIFCLPANSQVLDGVPDEGIGGGNDILAITNVSPGVDVPMGTKVELSATTNGSFNVIRWDAACGGVNPWRTKVDWVGAWIDDCVGVPGPQTYRASNSSHTASKVVTFHEPNSAITTIGKVHVTEVPQIGIPSRFQQTMTTTLKWNNVPLGPCATLCYKEKVTIKATYLPFKEFLKFDSPDWYPTDCPVDAFGDSHSLVATMRWRSPDLFDENWWTWNVSRFNHIQDLPLGTVLAERQHQYQFYGKTCDKWQWGPFIHTVWLDLIVMQAKNAQGNPVPIPNSNPQRFYKLPVWVVRS